MVEAMTKDLAVETYKKLVDMRGTVRTVLAPYRNGDRVVEPRGEISLRMPEAKTAQVILTAYKLPEGKKTQVVAEFSGDDFVALSKAVQSAGLSWEAFMEEAIRG